MRRAIYEALRDILIIIALATTAFLWGMQRGMQRGIARQDALWQQALQQKLAEYQCVKK